MNREDRQFAEAVFRERMAKRFSKLRRNLCPQIQETRENYMQDKHKIHLGMSQENG